MMKAITSAELSWLSDGCCDVKYLDIWDKSPVSYVSGQAVNGEWHTNHHEEIIARDFSGDVLQRAARLLLTYQFYPPDIITYVSDFSLENRSMRMGDRIVQRIHLLHLFRYSILDVVGITQVQQTIEQSRRCGFSYVTVAPHVAQGEWSIQVKWRQNGDVVLAIDAISRPTPREPQRNHAFIRSFQAKAHLRGIAHFKHLLLT